MPRAWPFFLYPKICHQFGKICRILGIFQPFISTAKVQAAQGSAKEKTKMIYYRVKPEKDNVPKCKKGSLAQDGIYIGNELYTETEWRKHCATHIHTEGITEPVNISPKETYWFFGARFQDKEE